MRINILNILAMSRSDIASAAFVRAELYRLCYRLKQTGVTAIISVVRGDAPPGRAKVPGSAVCATV